MWVIFKPFANLIDKSPDKSLDEFQAEKYSAALGLTGWVVLCVLMVIFFVCITWWRGSTFKLVEYFSVDDTRKISAISTLPQPVYTNTRIQSWVANIVSETLSFNFINVEDKIGSTDMYFTSDAAAAMRASIEVQEIVEKVKKSRLSVTVSPLSPPRMVGMEPHNGEAVWSVEAPILLTYTSASSSSSESLLVTVRIKQVPASVSPDGLLIVTFFTSSYNY